MDVCVRDLKNAALLLEDIGTADYVNPPTAEAMQEAAADLRRIAADHLRGVVDPSDEAVSDFIEAWAHDYANDDWRALTEADQLRVGRAMMEAAHTTPRGAVGR